MGTRLGQSGQLIDALVQVVLSGLRQGVRDILCKVRQRDLFKLVAGVMQGGDAFVDQKLGKTVDRYGQFDKVFDIGCRQITLPGIRQGLVFLQQRFGRTEHFRDSMPSGSRGQLLNCFMN